MTKSREFKAITVRFRPEEHELLRQIASVEFRPMQSVVMIALREKYPQLKDLDRTSSSATHEVPVSITTQRRR